MSANDGHDAPYRYEAQVTVIIAAGGMDKAMHVINRLTKAAQDDPDVIKAMGGHPRHRNDLDGALR